MEITGILLMNYTISANWKNGFFFINLQELISWYLEIQAEELALKCLH